MTRAKPLPCHPPVSLMGTAVMGERGQVVIPKEVRDNLGLEPGARLMVLQHNDGAVALIPADRMRAMLKEMNRRVDETLKNLNV